MLVAVLALPALVLSAVDPSADSLLQALVPVLAAVGGVVAARRRVLGRRSPWLLIALGQLCNGVGNVAFTTIGTLWRIDEVAGGASQALFLLATGLELLAVVRLAQPRDLTRLARAVVEGLLISAVLFTVLWAYGLGTGLQDPSLSEWVAALGLVELVWGLVALGLVVAIFTGRLQSRSPVPGPEPLNLPLLIPIALITAVVGDLFFAVPDLINGVGVPAGVQVFWLLSSMLFAAAPWWGPLVTSVPSAPVSGMSRFTVLSCGAGALALVLAGPGRVDGFVLIGAGLVLLLVTGLLASAAADNGRLTRRLADSERHFRSLVDTTSDVMIELDPLARIGYASPAVGRLLGLAPDGLQGRDWEDLAVEDDRHEAIRLLQEPADRPRLIRLRGASGPVWTETIANPLDGGGHVLAVRNVEDRVQLVRQLRHQSVTDHLTGLPNRFALEARLAEAVAAQQVQGPAVGLLYCDLDGFKDVNDICGHAVGDAVLREVARRLVDAAQGRGEVMRFGGDEFAVLMPQVDSLSALRVLSTDLVEAVRQPFIADGETHHLALSVGVAMHEAGSPAADLIRKADLAMIHAKTGGWGGVVVYSPRMHEEAVERVRTRAHLRSAVATARPELRFQPQVRLSDGAVVGVEALVAWREPGGALLDTESVIELAESTGAIVELGARVLLTATRHAARWRADGHDIRTAVNLSVRQLTEPGMVEIVERALAESGLPASALVLELTESMLVAHSTGAQQTLEQLRATGVRLAVDDFGTGYSGLDHLRRLTVDEVKIDRSFLSEAGTRARPTALLRGIIRLGHDLGLPVVGEGVETLQQARVLRRMGCDTGQGYGFAASLSPEQVPGFLALGPFDLDAAEAPPTGRVPRAASPAPPRPRPQVGPRSEPVRPDGEISNVLG
jgi:diguanylate cyclase (GGDEF)-like protein/PAS domain S-box-containing protein